MTLLAISFVGATPLLAATLAAAPELADATSALAQLALSAPVKILEGRLLLNLPKGAKLEPRGGSIMEAPESTEEEDRVQVDAGDERLVIMVHELFATAGPDARWRCAGLDDAQAGLRAHPQAPAAVQGEGATSSPARSLAA